MAVGMPLTAWVGAGGGGGGSVRQLPLAYSMLQCHDEDDAVALRYGSLGISAAYCGGCVAGMAAGAVAGCAVAYATALYGIADILAGCVDV